MSKAILVMDMPQYCDECDLHYERDCSDYCSIGNEYIDINVLKSKPKWCPLKEVPQKRKETSITNYKRYVQGWNDCIDRILEGSEEDE